MKAVKTSFGFALLKAPAGEGYRKVLVAGLGRSGTSSIASLLRNAGFYLGEVQNSATREDPVLRDLLGQGEVDRIRATLDDWAAKHELIAWKDPKLVGDHGRRLVHSLPQDWAVIVIFRDPLATTMRLVSQHGGDLMALLTNGVRRQKKLLKMVDETQQTLLLVSYEKLMMQPLEVCRELLGFLLPERISSLDMASIWEKTTADQRMYRSEAGRAKAVPLSQATPAHEAPEKAATKKRGSKGAKRPARKRARPGGANTT